MWKIPLIRINDNGKERDFGRDVCHDTLIIDEGIHYLNIQGMWGTRFDEGVSFIQAESTDEEEYWMGEPEVECVGIDDYLRIFARKYCTEGRKFKMMRLALEVERILDEQIEANQQEFASVIKNLGTLFKKEDFLDDSDLD